jgi:hypothetical protein
MSRCLLGTSINPYGACWEGNKGTQSREGGIGQGSDRRWESDRRSPAGMVNESQGEGMMQHTPYKCPPGCDNPYCCICVGGLISCTVCNGAEGSLPTECPGSPMGSELEAAVYAGKRDYINGQWVNRSNRPPPVAH